VSGNARFLRGIEAGSRRAVHDAPGTPPFAATNGRQSV
jgi:hypothetical protein